jgi:glycosyltransferase involved in cell wall biosynthesis
MTLETYQSPPSATSPVTFAFVTPVFNEAGDIDATMAAMLAQKRPAEQIIIVDDGSTDGTRTALRKWEAHPCVTVLEHDRNRGAGAARNSGIESATTDVVVFVDGDDSPPPDFLERLAPFYETGFDCVSVESRWPDKRSIVTRFLEAEHIVSSQPGSHKSGFTAGFSCRRHLAKAVGFPDELPGCGGEDGEFFRRLTNIGVRPAVDSSIVVERRMPTTFRGFWDQWSGRGRPIPYVDLSLHQRSLNRTTLRRAAAVLRSLGRSMLLLPNAASAAKRTRKSPKQWRDFAGFWVLCHVRTLAVHRGAWESLYRLWIERISLHGSDGGRP